MEAKDRLQTEKRMTPQWSTWKKRPECSLRDAVAISMNINPSALPTIMETTPAIKTKFLSRLKTACLQARPNGEIKVVKDQHSEFTKRPDTQIITLSSFIAFAKKNDWSNLPKKFLALGSQTSDSLADDAPQDDQSYVKPKRKAPDIFVAEMIRLFIEIAKRTTKSDLSFDPSEMPGTKEEFRQLAEKYSAKLEMKPRTFDDYLFSLCKFKQGRPAVGATNFYANLFPEYF